MLSVDKGYRKRGIGMHAFVGSSSRSPLTDPRSIRVSAAFHQCHAGQWGTGGKAAPLPHNPPHSFNPIQIRALVFSVSFISFSIHSGSDTVLC
jgi:hypothetical protein